MPSLRSYLFREIIKGATGMLKFRDSIDSWRHWSAAGSSRPRIPKGVTLRAVEMGGVPCEWLIPEGAGEDKTILYLHGGGWILGWYNSHRWMAGYIAKACGVRALAVDYRLAPENPFPAGLDDCLSVYRCLLESGTRPENIVIAGDSAGGTFTLAMLLALKDNGEPLPAAGIGLSPATDLAPHLAPGARPTNDAGLPRAIINVAGPSYLAGADPHQPLISPIYGDLHGLPPLLIQAGGDEYLLEDAVRFTEKARLANADIQLSIYPHMWHVWQVFVPYLPEAKQAVNEIAGFVRKVWNR